jgi:hypothetical protein
MEADANGLNNADCSLASDESSPNSLLLGVHDVFHHRKTYSTDHRVDRGVLTLHPTGHGILLHVPER